MHVVETKSVLTVLRYVPKETSIGPDCPEFNCYGIAKDLLSKPFPLKCAQAQTSVQSLRMNTNFVLLKQEHRIEDLKTIG